MIERTCCFFGHRKIEDTMALRTNLYETIERLIAYENTQTFLFGSKSEFNSLCHETVTKIKEKYPHIKRVYVRAEYPYIDESYKAYLLKHYEDTYFPSHIINAGKASYIERNFYMIDKSHTCIVYYNFNYTPQCKNVRHSLNSGTKTAYDYAVNKERNIINVSHMPSIEKH